MIVCSCFGTTDREIREASLHGRARECPAGRGCGNCRPTVEQILADAGRMRADGDRSEHADPDPALRPGE